MSEESNLAPERVLTNYFQKTKDKLDGISSSFCLAKWNQVTIHLSNGTTQSCHHCRAHKIPLDELKNNPSALHNTMQKKLTRKQMLNGERPSECDFCWRVEDLKEPDVFSDRVRKSSDSYNVDDLDTLPKMPWDTNIQPRYIELDFSNACNFKCMYCSPSYSTTWTKEIKEHGPYSDGASHFNSFEALKAKGEMPIEKEEDNPYIAAFWKWLPEAIKTLKVIRLTGGEPLLSSNTFKLIEYFLANPQPELKFYINSNLGAPKQYIDKLILYSNKLLDSNSVKEVKIYTSGEAHGRKGEYIRYGLNYKYWLENVDRILTEVPKLSGITCMCTYNALSATSFTRFSQDLHKIVLKHCTIERPQALFLSIPYLRHPDFLCGWILTEDYLKYMDESVEYLKSKTIEIYRDKDGNIVKFVPGFPEASAHDMKRVAEVMRNAIVNGVGRLRDVSVGRRAFQNFIDEFDKRRNTSFLTVFPEMAEFYYFCKTEYP